MTPTIPAVRRHPESAGDRRRVPRTRHSRRPVYQLTEPVIRFQQLVIRPREATLAARGGLQVWRDCADTVTAKIYGPHLEDLAREWVLAHADA